MSVAIWLTAVFALIVAAIAALATVSYARLARSRTEAQQATDDAADYLRPLDRKFSAKPSVNIQLTDQEEIEEVRRNLGASHAHGVTDFEKKLEEESDEAEKEEESSTEVNVEMKEKKEEIIEEDEQKIKEDEKKKAMFELEVREAHRKQPDIPVLDWAPLRRKLRLQEHVRPLRMQTHATTFYRMVHRVYAVFAPEPQRMNRVLLQYRVLDLSSYDAVLVILPPGRHETEAMSSEMTEAEFLRPKHADEAALMTAMHTTQSWQGASDGDIFVCIANGELPRADVITRAAARCSMRSCKAGCITINEGNVPNNDTDDDRRTENSVVSLPNLVGTAIRRSRINEEAIIACPPSIRKRPELSAFVSATIVAEEGIEAQKMRIPSVSINHRVRTFEERHEIQSKMWTDTFLAIQAAKERIGDDLDVVRKAAKDKDDKARDALTKFEKELPEAIQEQVRAARRDGDIGVARAVGAKADLPVRPLSPGDSNGKQVMQRAKRSWLSPKARYLLRKGGVRVWISLTTSPARMSHVQHVLACPDLRHVSGVFLNLPDKYRPTGEEYTVPARLIGSCPQLWINRCKRDIGPATKIIPGVSLLQASGRLLDDIIISFDDDQFYARSVVTSLINYAAELGNRCAVGGVGNVCEQWRLAAFPAEKNRSEGKRKSEISRVPGAKPVDIVEGFGAIAYRLGHMEPVMLTRQVTLSKHCIISDDLVISWHLAERGVSRATVYADHRIWQCVTGYGREGDALHVQCQNETKYQLAEQRLKKQRQRIEAIAAGNPVGSRIKPMEVARESVRLIAGGMGDGMSIGWLQRLADRFAPGRVNLVAGSALAKDLEDVDTELITLRRQVNEMGGLHSMFSRRATEMRKALAELRTAEIVLDVPKGH